MPRRKRETPKFETRQPTKPMTGEEMRKEMEKQGLRPATLAELKAFGNLVPDTENNDSVIDLEEGKDYIEKKDPKLLK